MNINRLSPALLAAALVLAGCASTQPNMLASDAPRTLPASGPVSVSWADPASFTEIRFSPNRYDAVRGTWLTQLAEHMRDGAAKHLAPGHRLELTIIDIDRAGGYEPWLGPQRGDTRIVRDIYPPRMTVRYRELDANGNVIAEDESKFSDPAFLTGASPINDSDPLRYEKRMIDTWLRREFRDDTAAR